MLHHRLKDVGRQLVGVHRGEGPAKVVESVRVARGCVLVPLGKGGGSRLPSGAIELDPEQAGRSWDHSNTIGEKPRIGRRCSTTTGWSEVRASRLPLLS